MPEPRDDQAFCSGPTCEATIIWARTEAGKLLPLDAEPSDNGNVRYSPAAVGSGRAQVLGAKAAAEARAAGEKLFLPHFVTCPDRDRFKR